MLRKRHERLIIGMGLMAVWSSAFVTLLEVDATPVVTYSAAPYEGRSQAVVTNEPAYQGVEVINDLPRSQHVKNRAAAGLGCCVFAAMDMDARYHNVRELVGVIDKISVGGGWPEKVDRVIKEYAPGLEYVQYTGTDPAILDQAMAEGRPCCVTYGYGERYHSSIQHMVLLVHLDGNLACIIDNNFPGTWEWMPRDEFLYRWVHPNRSAWAYAFLVPGPPPPPSNRHRNPR
jgi:hypothetical protein